MSLYCLLNKSFNIQVTKFLSIVGSKVKWSWKKDDGMVFLLILSR